MPQKETDINLRRDFTHTQLGSDISGGQVLVSLDLGKAFDSVDWTYVWVVLWQMGFGLIFLQCINLLYEHTVVAIKVNGEVFDFFPGIQKHKRRLPLIPRAVHPHDEAYSPGFANVFYGSGCPGR